MRKRMNIPEELLTEVRFTLSFDVHPILNEGPLHFRSDHAHVVIAGGATPLAKHFCKRIAAERPGLRSQRARTFISSLSVPHQRQRHLAPVRIASFFASFVAPKCLPNSWSPTRSI